MAKFSRFDPRNKKRGNHKRQSINKDLKIREDRLFDSNKLKQSVIREVMYDDADWSNTYLEESVGRDRQL